MKYKVPFYWMRIHKETGEVYLSGHEVSKTVQEEALEKAQPIAENDSLNDGLYVEDSFRMGTLDEVTSLIEGE